MSIYANPLAQYAVAGVLAVIGLLIPVLSINRLRAILGTRQGPKKTRWLFGAATLWFVMAEALAVSFVTTGEVHDWAISVIAVVYLIWPFIFFALLKADSSQTN